MDRSSTDAGGAMMLFFLVCIVLPMVLAYRLAPQKGRPQLGFMLLGWLGVVILLCMKDMAKADPAPDAGQYFDKYGQRIERAPGGGWRVVVAEPVEPVIQTPPTAKRYTLDDYRRAKLSV